MFGEVDLDRQPGRHRARDLVLDFEQLVERDVEAIRPDHVLRLGLDQLHHRAQVPARSEQAAAQKVAGPQALAEVPGRLRLQREQRGGMAGDHGQAAEPAEVRDDPFDHDVAERLVRRVARQVRQGQHGDRRLEFDGVGRRFGAVGMPDGGPGRCGGSIDREDLDDLADALQREASQETERHLLHIAHRSPDPARDDGRSGIGQALDARRDVDAMGVDDLVIAGNLAEVGRDAELDRFPVLPAGLLAKLRLHLDREADRLLGTFEQGQDAVPGDLDDAPAVEADEGFEQVDRAGRVVGVPDLVLFDPAAVAHHVGHQDGGQLAPTLTGTPVVFIHKKGPLLADKRSAQLGSKSSLDRNAAPAISLINYDQSILFR